MQNFITIIKDAGYKLTKPRQAVLGLLSDSENPLTISEISENGDINFASVFRVIKIYDELGILNRYKFDEKVFSYELKKDSHHHLGKCNVCGKLTEIDVCIVNKIEKLTGFKITDHSLEFVGICPNCQ